MARQGESDGVDLDAFIEAAKQAATEELHAIRKHGRRALGAGVAVATGRVMKPAVEAVDSLFDTLEGMLENVLVGNAPGSGGSTKGDDPSKGDGE